MWDPIRVQLLLASTRPDLFTSQLLSQHKLVVKSQFYIAMARYTNNSGITRRAVKEKLTEREARVETGWQGTLHSLMLRHMLSIC